MKKQSKIEIKKLLPSGYLKILIERSGYGKDTVLKVINQNLIAHPVWPFVLTLAEENQETINKSKARTDALISETPVSLGKRLH